MKLRKKICTGIIPAAAVVLPFFAAAAAVQNPRPARLALQASAGLHMPFVENKGQVADPSVAYVADTFACRVSVTRDGQVIYSLPRDKDDSRPAPEIRERIASPEKVIEVGGSDPRAARVSYFQGRDPSRWHNNLQSYGRVDLGTAAPGIGVELEAHGNNVEKIFHVRPGADPAAIRLAVEGAKDLRVGPEGDLVLSGASGSLRFTRPVAYQYVNGKRIDVPARYTVSQNTYGFALGDYDTSRELVIDPLIHVFDYGCGIGCQNNAFLALAADARGNVYAAGYVGNSGGNQLVIFKLDRRIENILGAAYFCPQAGYQSDVIKAMALDSRGRVFVAGRIISEDLPVTPGCHDNHTDSLSEGFVARFSADLTTIQAATYIGGDYYEAIYDLAIDAEDRVYVAGCSSISVRSDVQPFPVASGAYDKDPGPIFQKKAVVARLDNDLTTVQASTFLGGSVDDAKDEYEDRAYCLALDGQGNVWVAGRTTQPDFPVTAGCLDTTYNGQGDVFLSKLDADLTTLLVSTHIGGSNEEMPTDLLLDNKGDLYLTGWTYSGNFPMPAGGFDSSFSNFETDGFVLKLDPSGGKILAGTYLGGDFDNKAPSDGDDVPCALALTADGSQLLVVGRTESYKFPTTPGALDNVMDSFASSSPPRNQTGVKPEYGDGFIVTLSSDLTRLIYSTFVGSDGCEYLDAVIFNGDDILVSGETQTGDFPLAPANHNAPRAVLMRFNAGETPPGPGPGPVDKSSGGGGGGGCFVTSCMI